MATTDNKVLDGAGVAQLSQLVKDAIAQGGGTEYSAGSGISISDDDKINLNYFPVGLNHMTTLARGYTNHTWMIKTYSTKEEVVAGLLRGEVVFSVASARLSQGSFGIIENRAVLFYVEVTASGITYTTDMYNNEIAIFYKYLYLMDNILFVSNGITKEQFIETLIKDGIYYNNSTSGLTANGVGSAIDELATKIPSLATTETAGTVIPDGTTITIDSNGVISSQGGGGSSLPSDPVVDGSYKLVNTVATVEGTQTATQSWEEDAGYTATNGIQIDNGVIKPGIDIMKGNMLLPLLTSYLNGSNISNNWVNIRALTNCASYTIDDVKLSLETFGFFITPRVNSDISYTWEDIFELLGLDTSTTYYEAYMEQYSSSSTGYYISSNSSSTLSLSGKPTKDCIHFYLNNITNINPGNFFFCIPAGYNSSLALAANGKVDMRDTTLTGERYPTINKALIAFQNTRIADALVSTDTAPTVNNTINWVYK